MNETVNDEQFSEDLVDESGLQQYLYQQKVELIYQQVPNMLVVGFIAYSLLSYVLWTEENAQRIYIFYSVQLAVLFLRTLSLNYYEKISVKKWDFLNRIFQFINSVGLGCLLLFVVDYQSTEHIVLATLITMILLFGLVLAIPMFSIFYTTGAPTIIAMAISHYIYFPDFFVPLMLVDILSFFGAALVGKTLSANFDLSLKLQFKQQALLKLIEIEKDAATQANLAKSKFLAAASHDLRQPVHAISLLVSMLERQELPDIATKMVKKISSSNDSLRGLFDSLLDLSSLDAGVVENNASLLDTQVFCDEMMSLYSVEAKHRNLELKIDAEPQVIKTDAILLRRIISNFLSNALKYTEVGNITIAAKVDGDQVIISVSDTGPGISSEHQGLIFDEFFQLSNPERDREKGLGLGLAICKRLANILNIELSVESTLGQGTKMAVIIPVCEDWKMKDDGSITNESNLPSEDIVQGAGENFSLNGLRVLVVDDEKEIVDAMADLMKSWGCASVLRASGVEEACEAVKQQGNPDVIITDYQLRGDERGPQVIDAVSEQVGWKVPSLIITGNTSVNYLKESSEREYKILHKPVDPNNLYRSINALLVEGMKGMKGVEGIDKPGED